jgi:1-aminocyclopropane-1-carboxylate deaminase
LNEPKKFLGVAKMIPLDQYAITTQNISADWLSARQLQLDVLRLDKIHPVISGNKWFKVKYYLQKAKAERATTLATFGGAWSNHIAATAHAGKVFGISTVGIIRGEEPANPSITLQQAKADGMQLMFVSRQAYRDKQHFIQQHPSWYWVNEGGYGQTGTQGAAEILSFVDDLETYTHIVAAVGTGTMLAGLINASLNHQQVIGISSMKGNIDLEESIRLLLVNKSSSFSINHDFHFGGYGKHPTGLIEFINAVYHQHALPLDIVYTGKTFFAIKQLAEAGDFRPGSKILMIHSGGLQGNKSLPAQLLAF